MPGYRYDSSRDDHIQEVREYLATHGQDVNTADESGMVPLHSAARYGDEPLVRFLIQLGAGGNQRNCYGRTPLHFIMPSLNMDFSEARKNNQEQIARLLIQNGADVNIADNKGSTPLHEAFNRPAGINVMVVRLLLQNGADVHAVDKRLRTPLHCAVQSGHTESVKSLLAAGSPLNAKDDKGRTAIFLARRNHKVEIERLLRTAKNKAAEALRMRLYVLCLLNENTCGDLLRCTADFIADHWLCPGEVRNEVRNGGRGFARGGSYGGVGIATGGAYGGHGFATGGAYGGHGFATGGSYGGHGFATGGAYGGVGFAAGGSYGGQHPVILNLGFP